MARPRGESLRDVLRALDGNLPLGQQSEDFVVNCFGEWHEVKDLYPADGSIFPAAAGINPMLPIMRWQSKPPRISSTEN